MRRKSKLFPTQFVELTERVAKGGARVTLDFDTFRQARIMRDDFYQWRNALGREGLPTESAYAVMVRIFPAGANADRNEPHTLEFSNRDMSPAALRIQAAIDKLDATLRETEPNNGAA